MRDAKPVSAPNPPGLSSVAYRAGTWSSFRESMLARLSSFDYPALAPLRTRDDSDFTIALLDSTAILLDILTFYQERLANESYLRTATQVRSLTELSQLIGYRSAPAVAASVYLAFTLRTTPGLAPSPSALAITIPAGTQVQSIPGQDQTPQTFETSVPIQAKADWNAQAVQAGSPWTPNLGDTGVYLKGMATQLQPGDAILIVGDERSGSSSDSSSSGSWDVRFLSAVVPDPANHRTWVAWGEGLGGQDRSPAQQNPKVYVFRQRAALFGYNAPDPNLFNFANSKLGNLLDDAGEDAVPRWKWDGYALSTAIDLDALYPKVVSGSWVAMIAPTDPTKPSSVTMTSLYKANSVLPTARTSFGLSAKITRVTPDLTKDLPAFPLASTVVLAQSDQLEAVEQPLADPLYGTVLDLAALRPDLIGIQAVALSGKRQKISVNAGLKDAVTFDPLDGSDPAALSPGDVLTILDASSLPLNSDGSIPIWLASTEERTFYVQESTGRPGTVSVPLSSFSLAASGSADPVVQEYALVSSVLNVPSSPSSAFPANRSAHTRILLRTKLLNCFDRTSTTVNANVGMATHGESVSEVMGNGSASTPNQSFNLSQSPLTYVQSPTPTGRRSTIEVVAGSVAWREAPSLDGQGRSQRVFATQDLPGGTTRVLFGDGREGATLPSGVNNVIANYRVGSGTAGNVGAGTIAILQDRALQVSAVSNPQAATGGHNAQGLEELRASAPQTVVSLGRAVSLIDYEKIATAFGGVAKASATWISSGAARGVFLTVAGVSGAALPPENPTLANLVAALRDSGSPLVSIRAVSFVETLFGLSADVRYDPAYDQASVARGLRQTLGSFYSFANRGFGQAVSSDEVAAVMQVVPGILAVHVTAIRTIVSSVAGDLIGDGNGFSLARYVAWLSQSVTVTRPASASPTRISAYLPVATAHALPQPAEILILDPDPSQVSLRVMS